MAFFLSLWVALKEIVRAPFLEPGLWWQLIPILFLWMILELYLHRHKHEELGWNSALANAITLFWITMGAMQPLFSREIGEAFSWGRFLALLVILSYSLLLTYAAFTHKIEERLTYVLAWPTIVHYLSIMAILWGHKVLAINQYILIGLLLIWLLLFGLNRLFFWLLPEAEHASEDVKF